MDIAVDLAKAEKTIRAKEKEIEEALQAAAVAQAEAGKAKGEREKLLVRQQAAEEEGVVWKQRCGKEQAEVVRLESALRRATDLQEDIKDSGDERSIQLAMALKEAEWANMNKEKALAEAAGELKVAKSDAAAAHVDAELDLARYQASETECVALKDRVEALEKEVGRLEDRPQVSTSEMEAKGVDTAVIISNQSAAAAGKDALDPNPNP